MKIELLGAASVVLLVSCNFHDGVSALNVIYTGNGPQFISSDSSANLWVANSNDDTVTKVSSAGTVLNQYDVGDRPGGVVVDASDNVWVTKVFENTVKKLNSSGDVIGTFSVGNHPLFITSDKKTGNIWVSNQYSGSVTLLDSSGVSKFTIKIGSFASGIAIDSSSNAWVADNKKCTLVKVSPTGTILGTYKTGKNTNPGGVAIDSLGNVWVAAQKSKQLLKFSSKGKIVGKYKVGSLPMQVAVDSSNNVYVTNYISSSVSVYFNSGVLKSTIALDESTGPSGIVVNNLNNIWVSLLDADGITKIA